MQYKFITNTIQIHLRVCICATRWPSLHASLTNLTTTSVESEVQRIGFQSGTLTLNTLALALYQCVSSDPSLFKLLHRTGYIPACIEEQVVGPPAPFNHSDAAASFSCASWNSQLFEMLNHIGYI